jgi:hypothetical protein
MPLLWRDLLEKWGLTELRVKPPFLEAKFEPNDPSRAVAWALYVELLTRVATQPLESDAGDDSTALASIASLFPTTREILRAGGPKSVDAAYVAISFLNQVLRPFTTKWHPESLKGKFADPVTRRNFRKELGRVRKLLLSYTDLMGDLSGIQPAGQIRSLIED